MIIITMARKHLHPVRIGRQSWSGKCFPELGRKNEASGPKRKQCSVMDVSGVKVKSNAVKNNIAKESGKLGPLKKNSFGIFNALCSL